jgi:hypothetical protein
VTGLVERYAKNAAAAQAADLDALNLAITSVRDLITPN